MTEIINDLKRVNEFTPIVLYEFDFNTIVPKYESTTLTTLRLTNSAQSNGSDIVMNGVTYQQCGIKIENIVEELGSKPGNATLSIDNAVFSAFSQVSTLASSWQGNLAYLGRDKPAYLVGTTLNRIITMYEYNSDASWSATDKSYTINQRFFIKDMISVNSKSIDFEITPGLYLDSQNVMSRRMGGSICSLKYRVYNPLTSSFDYTPIEDGGCPYGQVTNGASGVSFTNYFDRTNTARADADRDYCAKNLQACMKRWDPTTSGAAIPFFANIKAGSKGTDIK